MKKNRLAIFDMDGTLFDTVRANYESYKDAVIKTVGDCGILLDDFKDKCFGKNYKVFLRDIFKVDDSLFETIHDAKCASYMDYIKEYVVENTFLFDVICGLKDTYYIALLTTASKKNTYELLDVFNKRDVFDLILTSEDVHKLKPDGEGFIKSMQYFGVDPCDTVIFDDSDDCLNTARELNIDCYKVIGEK
ncbi:MAG: HAD hydrolase-like protein [Lachnospiraceae bacterium]|nr:HAD hydrolase-like protein [Lachnospiraceae bacterium]